jgi:hypothetical protein
MKTISLRLDDKTLKRIYGFLELDLLEKFEYPCDECVYYECEKNPLNNGGIIKTRYRVNDIDHKRCLEHNRKQLLELYAVLRDPAFVKWSHEECALCAKKLFKHDMPLHAEIEEKPSVGTYRMEFFRLCKRCDASYRRRKRAIHKGYVKF